VKLAIAGKGGAGKTSITGGVLVGSRLWATTEAKVPTGLHDAALAADGDATTVRRALDIARNLPWARSL